MNLKVEALSKSFQGKSVLQDVSFQIREGEWVGIYGASGIGKSTIAKILCGVLQPDQGCVYLDDKLLFSEKCAYDRKTGLAIQMVYQQPYSALDYNQKIIQGFYELIRYHHFAGNRKEAQLLIEKIAGQVGIEMEILNHLPHQISGGEAQRIAIARSLLFHPGLLILDEATSMLDVSTQANILGMIRRNVATFHGSVLLISHDKELVDHLCDRVYVFADKQLQIKENTP